MTTQKYLFLIAWVSGCDENNGEMNGIDSQEDLYPQYLAGNPAVFAKPEKLSEKLNSAILILIIKFNASKLLFDCFCLHNNNIFLGDSHAVSSFR